MIYGLNSKVWLQLEFYFGFDQGIFYPELIAYVEEECQFQPITNQIFPRYILTHI